MLFAVLLQDDPERLHLREGHRDEHLAYVAAQGGRIIAVGALRPQPEDEPQGALWLVHADTKEAAQALVEGDPFFKLGLRRSVYIFHWRKGVWSEPFARCMSTIDGETNT
ncbi:YciI family protein [Microvirga arsenatis]|uniref:YCII-related domain-containing protein n=1 Tax=Microvirga arsenatis TaxID=2692265 RepID=A0ABW9YY42_9HYPH|nr:YciI family protein [Microvirga arsenatis]NBJ10687.1 hypothetical protein [Microvirga arsenatis]NBJ24415.1 hypothetical protein [Microvirga arsenatis]